MISCAWSSSQFTKHKDVIRASQRSQVQMERDLMAAVVSRGTDASTGSWQLGSQGRGGDPCPALVSGVFLNLTTGLPLPDCV